MRIRASKSIKPEAGLGPSSDPNRKERETTTKMNTVRREGEMRVRTASVRKRANKAKLIGPKLEFHRVGVSQFFPDAEQVPAHLLDGVSLALGVDVILVVFPLVVGCDYLKV